MKENGDCCGSVPNTGCRLWVFTDSWLDGFEILLWLNQQPFHSSGAGESLKGDLPSPFSFFVFPSFLLWFPWIIRSFSLCNPKESNSSVTAYCLMMVAHTIKKKIRLCKMEEVLSLGWLKCGKVPAGDLWWSGPGTQLGHVNQLLVKGDWDGTAINVWVADQELRTWIKKQERKVEN